MKILINCLLILCLFTFVKSGTGFKCVLNPYYRPVCGTDNKTYGNKDLLNCHNHMDRVKIKPVKIAMHRECKPLMCPSYDSLMNKAWPNIQPVCATNGFTYGHIHQIRCLKDFYPDLEIKHEGGCTLYEARRGLGRNARQKACHVNRRMIEQNPICLTNNVTYTNAFQAICTKPHLTERVGGTCQCPFQRACEQSDKLMDSLRTAPLAERNRFVVCGSDYKNYRSEFHLECSRRYNPYLFKLRSGPCRKMRTPCPESLKLVYILNPVCGSDQRSYTSYEALICAQHRISHQLTFLHSGACVKRT